MLYYALCQLSVYCLSATYLPFITFSAVVKHFSFAASVISSLASGGSWRGFLVLLKPPACFFFMNLAAVCLCVGRDEWGSIQWHSALAMCPEYTVILKSLSPNSDLVSSWASCTGTSWCPVSGLFTMTRFVHSPAGLSQYLQRALFPGQYSGRMCFLQGSPAAA